MSCHGEVLSLRRFYQHDKFSREVAVFDGELHLQIVLDISELPSGIYVLEANERRRKIVKQ